ncbi:MAG TPA: peptide-methionine (R)-S-oxide reductase MsrB [Chryseolinea sp.]|nr:peptide-methionine (R)-S-oxide reductase MsrB [Chryseolinea sp.]
MHQSIILVFLASVFACKPSDQKKEVNTLTPVVQISQVDTVGKIVKTEAEWKATLTPQQYHILREKGTDAPFKGEFTYTKDKGTYKCAACGNPLFTSDMKFESECGWPSFDKELAGDRIKTITDTSFGMVRTEILCARCGSHLGHLFDDGPTLTGKRYCVNSTSLDFTKEKK